MAESSIEWTEATWNPIAGCSLASPGCTNCYAMRMAARLACMGLEKYVGTTRKSGKRDIWTGQIKVDENSINAPLKWKSPRKIFVNSMSDLFHESVPEEIIFRIWNVMKQTPRHTYQILTKRSGRMQELSNKLQFLPNAWLGVSVENEDASWRISDLKATVGAVKFVSFEPLLGPITSLNLSGIDWAIVGGESGPQARPISQTWVDPILSACRRSDTAFFFKQWGGTNKKRAGRIFKGRTWDEYPHMPIA